MSRYKYQSGKVSNNVFKDLVPASKQTDNALIIKQLRDIVSGLQSGGTVSSPALQSAIDGLQNSKADQNHTHNSLYYTKESINALLSNFGTGDGASAYDIAVTNGFVGTEVEWLASLHGSDGVDGLPGTTNYNELGNKPAIPSKTSDLTNDSNFITVASVPTALSSLTEDATHRTVTDDEKSTWNGKQAAMGSDDNYVTDAEKAALHNHSNKTALDAMSGSNTGDQTLAGLGGVATNDARLSDARTPLSHAHAETDITGLVTDLSNKQGTLISGENIKTVNGNSLLGSGDIVITGGLTAPFTMYQLASPFSNATTTLQDVTGWSFAVTAGKVYRIEIIALYQTNTTTTGGKMGFYLPSGTGSICGYMEGGISSATVATELKAPIRAIGSSNLAGSFLLTSGVNAINTPHHIDGSLIFNCATSGVFQVQWAGEAATAAQINAGSVMLVTLLN